MGPPQPPHPPPQPGYLPKPPPADAAASNKLKGHHGTYRQRGLDILRQGFQKRMIEAHFRSAEGYLGEGVYFYLAPNGHDHAKRWVIQKCRTGTPEKDPGWEPHLMVIEAEIDTGRCLDFTSHEMIEVVEGLLSRMRDKRRIFTTDAEFIQFLANRMQFDTVIACYDWKPAFPGVRFRGPACRILCVRTYEKILNTKDAVDWMELSA